MFLVSLFFYILKNILAMGGVMAYLTTLGFVLISLIYSLTFFSFVVTNEFLEDMILVLDLLYPIYYKTKLILPEVSIGVYPFPQQWTMPNKIPVIQSFYFKFCFITLNWSNYLHLASLGNPTKEVQLKISKGILKGFPPLSFFYI